MADRFNIGVESQRNLCVQSVCQLLKIVQGFIFQNSQSEIEELAGPEKRQRADMEFVKKFTQASFLKTKFYPKGRKSQ